MISFNIPITHASGRSQVYGWEQQVRNVRFYIGQADEYYRMSRYHLDDKRRPTGDTILGWPECTLRLDVVFTKDQSVNPANAVDDPDLANYQLQPNEVRGYMMCHRVLGDSDNWDDGYLESNAHMIFMDNDQGFQWYTRREIDPKRYVQVGIDAPGVFRASVDLTYNALSSRVVEVNGKDIAVPGTDKVELPAEVNTRILIRSEDGVRSVFNTKSFLRNDITQEVNYPLILNAAPVIAYKPTESGPVSLAMVDGFCGERYGYIETWFKNNVPTKDNGEYVFYCHTTSSWFSINQLKFWISEEELYYGVAMVEYNAGRLKCVMRKFKAADSLPECYNAVQPDFVGEPDDIECTIVFPNAFEPNETTITFYGTSYMNPFGTSNYICLNRGQKDVAEKAIKVSFNVPLTIVRITYANYYSYTHDITYIEKYVDNKLEFTTPEASMVATALYDSGVMGSTNDNLVYKNKQADFEMLPTAPGIATTDNQLVNRKTLINMLSQLGLLPSFTNVSITIRANFDSSWSQIGYLEIYTNSNKRLVPLYVDSTSVNEARKMVFKEYGLDELPENAASDFNGYTGTTTMTVKSLADYELQPGERFATLWLPDSLKDGCTQHTWEQYIDPFYRDGYNGLLWTSWDYNVHSVCKIDFEGEFDYMNVVNRVRFKTVRYTNSKTQVIIKRTQGQEVVHDSGEVAYNNQVMDYRVE